MSKKVIWQGAVIAVVTVALFFVSGRWYLSHVSSYYASVLAVADSLNSRYLPVTGDSLLAEAAAWYDRHGSANDRMKAHYLLGCAYRDSGEAPAALSAYYDAVSMADTASTTCDTRILMVLYGQMSLLYAKQNMPEQSIRTLEKAIGLAIQRHDVVSELIFKSGMMAPLFEQKQFDRIFTLADEMIVKYDSIGDTVGISYATLLPIRISLKQEDTQRARTYLRRFMPSAFSPDNDSDRNVLGFYYAYMGIYHTQCHRPDSALHYFSACRPLMKGIPLQLVFYKGLYDFYSGEGVTDSIRKYAELFTQYNDSSAEQLQTTAMVHTERLYDYSRHQKVANLKTLQSQQRGAVIILLLILMAALSLSAYYLVRLMKRKNRIRLIAANKRYVNDLNKYLQLKQERDTLLREHLTIHDVIRQRDDVIAQLQERLSMLQADFTDPSQWENEDALLDSEIVKSLHVKASRGKSATLSDWNQLRSFLNQYMPAFIPVLSHYNDALTIRETNLCILIRLRFIPSETATLLDSSEQTLANLRVRLMKKIFNKQGGAREFNEMLIKMQI